MSFSALALLVGGLVIAGGLVVDYFSRPHGHNKHERAQH